MNRGRKTFTSAPVDQHRDGHGQQGDQPRVAGRGGDSGDRQHRRRRTGPGTARSRATRPATRTGTAGPPSGGCPRRPAWLPRRARRRPGSRGRAHCRPPPADTCPAWPATAIRPTAASASAAAPSEPGRRPGHREQVTPGQHELAPVRRAEPEPDPARPGGVAVGQRDAAGIHVQHGRGHGADRARPDPQRGAGDPGGGPFRPEKRHQRCRAEQHRGQLPQRRRASGEREHALRRPAPRPGPEHDVGHRRRAAGRARPTRPGRRAPRRGRPRPGWPGAASASWPGSARSARPSRCRG